MWTPLLLVLAGLTGAVGTQWRSELFSNKGNPHSIGASVFDLIDDLEGRVEEEVQVVLLLNADSRFFQRCKPCAALDSVFKAITKHHHENGGKQSGLRFVRVEYTQSTQKLTENKNIVVPALFALTSEVSSAETLKVYSKQAIAGLEAERSGGASTPALAFLDVSGVHNRRQRRALKHLPAHLIDEAVIGTEEGTTIHSVAHWVSLVTNITLQNLPKEQKTVKEEKVVSGGGGGGGGGGVSLMGLVMFAGAVVSFGAFLWRAFEQDKTEDVVQEMVRANAWWIAFGAHAFITGGLHWCVLHGAAPMGGSLFMPGRRGQFLIEGIIVTVYVSLGAYSLLALHRMRLHVAQPKTLLVAAERVAEGGAHELIRVAIAGLIFAFVLVLITFLHKNYWYLRGTVLRQMVMTK